VKTAPILLAGALLLASAQSLPAEDSATFLDALKGGKTSLSFRYRLETVDQANIPKSATASTLRTALGYRTGTYRNFSAFLEVENVTALWNDDSYRNAGAGSLGNGVTDRPVIADPEITEIDQAYLRYVRGDTSVTAGRQALDWGDQRFLGTVGWRQNHQSFDALELSAKALPRLRLRYAFIGNTHRIFGDDKPMTSHLLQGEVDLGDIGKLTLYGFQLDYDRPADAGLSTRTVGAELAGKRSLGTASFLYEAELARQEDAGDNPFRVDAGYLNGRLGLAWPAVTVQLGYEVLEGSSREGRFTTPLATLHKFNGWGDLFLNTPPDGLEDIYLSLSGKVKSVDWKAIYHSSSRDFGTEVDLEVSFAASWGQTFSLKAALYDADDFASDTDKLWFTTSYHF
jgi:hypothetical protein